MATVQEPRTRNRPDSFVEAELGRARRRIRSQDVGVAALGLLAGTLVYALAMVLLDRWLILPDLVRQLSLFAFLAGAAVYVGVILTRPFRHDVNPYFAARKVERALPGAKNSVVSWLDLHDKPLPASIRAAVTQKAASDLERADVDEVVRDRRLSWLGGIAGGLVLATLILFFLFRPNQFLSLLGRAFAPFGSSEIAHQTNLHLLQPAHGDVTVPVNTPVDFRVDVEGRIPSPNSPEAVRIRFKYNPADPIAEEVRLEQSPAEPQRFSVRMPSSRVQNGFVYQILAGDAATPEYRVQVRSSPLIDRFEVVYRFRPYLRFKDQVTSNPNIEGLYGTQVTLTARTNRAIASGELRFYPVRPDQAPRAALQAERVPGEPNSLRFRFVLQDDAKYTIGFRTTDGELSEGSVPYTIKVLSDHAPQVEITRPTPDTIPVNGKLEVEGKASDDFGVTAMRLCMQVADPMQPRALQSKSYRPGKSFKFADGTFPRALDYKDYLPLEQIKSAFGAAVPVKPGMVIEYWLEADDNCDSPKPNVGKSKVYRVTLGDEQSAEDKKAGEAQASEGKSEHDQKQDQNLAQQNAEKQGQPRDEKQNGDQGETKPNDDLQEKIDKANKAAANERERQQQRGKGESKDNPPPQGSDQAPKPGESKGDKNDNQSRDSSNSQQSGNKSDSQGNAQNSQKNSSGQSSGNQGNDSQPQQGGNKGDGKGDPQSGQPEQGGGKGENKPDQQENPGSAKDMNGSSQPHNGGDNQSSPQQPNADNKSNQSPNGQNDVGDNKSSPSQPNAGNKSDQNPNGQNSGGDSKSSPSQPNAGNRQNQNPGGQNNSGDSKSSNPPNAGNKSDQNSGAQSNPKDKNPSAQQPKAGNQSNSSSGGQQNVGENKPNPAGGADNSGDKKDQPKNGQQPGEAKDKSQPNGAGQKAGGDNSQGNPNQTTASNPPSGQSPNNRSNEQKGSQPDQQPSDAGNAKPANRNRTPTEDPQKNQDNANSQPNKEPGKGGAPGKKDQASERPGEGPKKDPNNREPNGRQPNENDPGRDGPGSKSGSGKPGGAQPNDPNRDKVPEGQGTGGTREPGEAKSQMPSGSGNKGEAKPDGGNSDDTNPGEQGGPTGQGQLQDAPKPHDRPGASTTTKPKSDGTASNDQPQGGRNATPSTNPKDREQGNGRTGQGQGNKKDQDSTNDDQKSGQGQLSKLARDLKSDDPQTRKAAEQKLRDLLDKAGNDPEARRKIEQAMKGDGDGLAKGSKNQNGNPSDQEPRNPNQPGDPTNKAGQPKGDPNRQQPKQGQDSRPGPGDAGNDPAQSDKNQDQRSGSKSGMPKPGDQEPNDKGTPGNSTGPTNPGNKNAGNSGTGAPTADRHSDQPNERGAPTSERGLAPDPQAANKTSDLQLNRFPKNPSKEMLQEMGMTPEQYRQFLKDVAELQKKRAAESAKDRQRGGNGASAANSGAKRVEGGTEKPGQLERGGTSLPPPEYRDGYKTFTEEVAKPGSGTKKD